MTQQLRGEQLKVAIKDNIKLLVKNSKSSDQKKINLSALAVAVGTSRTTLNKMIDFIDECLVEAKFERRQSYGKTERNNLEIKIIRLESTIKDVKKELDALRSNHLEIYRRLYANSSELSALIKPVVIKDVDKYNNCILCGNKLNKIVNLIPSK